MLIGGWIWIISPQITFTLAEDLNEIPGVSTYKALDSRLFRSHMPIEHCIQSSTSKKSRHNYHCKEGIDVALYRKASINAQFGTRGEGVITSFNEQNYHQVIWI